MSEGTFRDLEKEFPGAVIIRGAPASGKSFLAAGKPKPPAPEPDDLPDLEEPQDPCTPDDDLTDPDAPKPPPEPKSILDLRA